MKRYKAILILMLVAALSLSLSACGKNNNNDDPDPSGNDGPISGGEITGGWEMGSVAETALPENVKSAMDKALEGFAGSTFTPVAYLGSQVVAGTNYAVLCKAETSTYPPVTSLKILTISEGLDGSAALTDIADFKLSEYDEKALPQTEPGIDGGWNISDEASSLTKEEADIFNEAMANLMGVKYEPIKVLGSQVVAGTNYAYLCRATASTLNAEPVLAVVKVYKPLEGNAELLSIYGFEISEFANAGSK